MSGKRPEGNGDRGLLFLDVLTGLGVTHVRLLLLLPVPFHHHALSARSKEMMRLPEKSVFVVSLVVCLCAAAAAGSMTTPRHDSPLLTVSHEFPTTSHAAIPAALNALDVDHPEAGGLCNACVQLSGQSLNILLNYILNAGVVGGCHKLCGALNSSKAENLACNVVCDVVGIKEFIHILNSTDLDPIYFCELLHVCPAGNDNATASITSVAVSPASGPAGTTFTLSLNVDVQSATGVGEIRVAVEGGMIQIGQGFVNTGFPPGPRRIDVSLQAKDDPSAEPPVQWLPGAYDYAFEFCQGECGSKHPHSKVFGKKGGSFNITASA